MRSQPREIQTMTTNRSLILGLLLKGMLRYSGVVILGAWLGSVRPADAGSNFLPVPGEVPPAALAKPVLKTNNPSGPVALATVTQQRQVITGLSTGTDEWGTYVRERGNKVVLDGKLVDKSTLTPLVGFLGTERTELSNGSQTFAGMSLDIAVRKADAGNVATVMALRPGLWRRTEEHVFLLDYEPTTTIPGALVLLYVVEVDSMEGWRTFKVGREPSFDDWQRLAGS